METQEIPDVPEKPPIEIIQDGDVWSIRTHPDESVPAEVFSSYSRQIDAVDAAKAKMEKGHHPCTLRWEGPQNVADIYWNPFFETLEARYDRILGRWTLVPAQGTCKMGSAQSRKAVCKKGKAAQYAHNFKHLRIYDSGNNRFEERDHRFLRHNITSSSVRYDPSGFD